MQLGFEFDSKIIPFGAKGFIENLSTFLIIAAISVVWELKGKANYRAFYVFHFIFSLFSTLLLLKVRFRKKKEVDLKPVM